VSGPAALPTRLQRRDTDTACNRFATSSAPPGKISCVPGVGREVKVQLVERAAARNLLDFVEAMRRVAPDLGAAAVACGDGVAAFLARELG
jgi:hypothetical protein